MSITLDGPAFLSVRLPPPSRDRLKAAAAARGETVQGLVGSLVAVTCDPLVMVTAHEPRSRVVSPAARVLVVQVVPPSDE